MSACCVFRFKFSDGMEGWLGCRLNNIGSAIYRHSRAGGNLEV
ncbi:hypothetical protein NEIELOOT_02056 [Neisseria elongata subsp. glycolytica ATCC 29315]|uniref:Uncharacterized protein n=1 Tax=Neisseria elongata subsp. glycolytica ATCC 29315 TaxID=546263 RepID=D4DSL0_NEIEG|nr:hypothetical protein NEIELOOT_02056 [Neisseria elongata subsp. glycolytica ATCC 29315]